MYAGRNLPPVIQKGLERILRPLQYNDFLMYKVISTEMGRVTFSMVSLLVLFLTEEAYSHCGLQTRKLGHTPLSVDQPQSER